jgi:CheY-like chemotaxis protein
MLRHIGYEALGVMGGQEAIDHLRDAKPDLIILDCNMPCTDGLAVRHVRADPRLADVPVVMNSGDIRPELRADVEQVGIQGWILKASSSDWDEIAHSPGCMGYVGRSWSIAE